MSEDEFRPLLEQVVAQPLTSAQLGLRSGDPVWRLNPYTGEQHPDEVWSEGPYREPWEMEDGSVLNPYAIRLVEVEGSAWLYLVTPREPTPPTALANTVLRHDDPFGPACDPDDWEVTR